MNKQEKVKKIICEACLKASGHSKCPHRKFPNVCEFCLVRSVQICQMFEPIHIKPCDEKLEQTIQECYSDKPKPDESRLSPSTQLEIATQAWKHFLSAYADKCDTDAVVDEIVSKTASIKDQECRQKMELMFNPDYLDFQKGVEVGKELCQQRLERIKDEIESHMDGQVIWKEESEWQNFWKRKEIDD